MGAQSFISVICRRLNTSALMLLLALFSITLQAQPSLNLNHARSLPSLLSINGEKLLSRPEVEKMIARKKMLRKKTLDSLQKRYNLISESKSVPYKEKVTLLRNIMDLRGGVKYGELLFELAKQQKDYRIQLEAIGELVQYGQKERNNYRKMLQKIPSSNAQKEIIALIDYKNTIQKFSKASKKEETEALQKMIVDYENLPESRIYERATKLFGLCMVMSKLSSNSLYQEYLQQLGDIISMLPKDGRRFLPYVYQSAAANFYYNKELQKAGYDVDMEMLKIEDERDSTYKSENRIYKSAEMQRYVTLRRIISYNTLLSKAQIQETYDKLVDITNRNPELYSEFHSCKSISSIRYLMAMERYKDVIPLLDSVTSDKKKQGASRLQRECMRDMITAKIALDKNADIQKYAEKYIDYLDEEKKRTLDEINNEMDILYDIDNLQEKTNSNFIKSCIIALAVVLALFGYAFYMLVSSRRLTDNLIDSKQKLVKEKKDLNAIMSTLVKAREKAENAGKMKTAFIQNMQHEIRTPLNAIVGFSKILGDVSNKIEKEDASKFAGIIRQNSAFLNTIVTDILDVTDMESGGIKFNIEPEDLNSICNFVVSIIEGRAADGVKMYFKHHDGELILNTDKKRLVQALLNFLTNSCKFTQTGSIVLDYEIKNEPVNGIGGDNGCVILSVTDTGPGIPAGKADVIFDRFEKLNKFSQGPGLGLYVCRLIAKGLHGEVKLDSSYSGGSRFLFIHPLNLKSDEIQ
mgnify:CR=1 FL=1